MKNAQILSTIFVAMTYGFSMPIIFYYLLIPLTLLAVIDRALLVYWFKPVVMQSDMLSKIFLDILKYCPVVFLISAAIAVC